MPLNQPQPRWLSLFLLLLLAIILLQSTLESSLSSSPSLVVNAVPAPPPFPAQQQQQQLQPQQLQQPQQQLLLLHDHAIARHNINTRTNTRLASIGPRSEPVARPADDSNATRSRPSRTSPSERGPVNGQDIPPSDYYPQPHPVIYDRVAIQQEPKVATHLCNEDNPEEYMAWNGTFSSTSGDGVDPVGARTCTWKITIPGDGTSTTGPSIIQLSFWSVIMLACGKDSLAIYDGPDTTSPLLANLCGNYWLNNLPLLYSSGSQLTVVFTKSADSPSAPGFTGSWSTVPPCNICLNSGKGTCKAGTCDCNSKYTGSVCQKETTGFEGFTPRSQHSMAYDSAKDMVYITGGSSSRSRWMWDLLTFSFATNKWASLTAIKSPDPRYGHFSFVHKGNLYIYGGMTQWGPSAEVWMYDTKTWTRQLPINLEKIPTGLIGPACVFLTNNNQTRLSVFGGMTREGVTMRELHYYDIETRQWSLADHQNSVGLSGASAVYHEATNSIYYFSGMINQTIRNTIPYQYSLDQELWFAHAPRFDPLDSRPVGWNGTMYIPTSSDGVDNNLDDPKGDGSYNSTTRDLQNPAMYDAISGVWASVGLAGSDMVVMYGGMRPFGLGTTKEASCLIRTMYLYDISCQKWASYDISDAYDFVKTRVNHTMVLRPPGAAGASKTSYTAYIFGGFDGYEHNDMVNITINIYPPAAADVNRCRALNWCSKYDDCQNCNPHYCSYINGLCLFDTDKAKKPVSSATPILLGGSDDVPVNGTLQGLLTQRPDLKSQVVKVEDCPSRIGVNTMTPYPGIIAAGNTLYFKTYIDEPDRDIQFDINTNPNEALVFRSLNVWEGFMNMYWRADHSLSDSTWDDSEQASTIPPDDLPANKNSLDWDRPVLTTSGIMNVTELMRRWTKYSGLDGSPSQSALQGLSTQGIYFLAGDPRRFSGYYVYSITNPTDIPITMTLTVNLLNIPEVRSDDKGSQLDLATLGFFMVGFIFGVFLLIILGRKLRRVIAERDEAQWAAAELRMQEEEAAEDERRGALGSQTNITLGGGRDGADQDGVEKKPMYRIVVGVQEEKDALWRVLMPPGSVPSTLRQRPVRKNESSPLARPDFTACQATTSQTGIPSHGGDDEDVFDAQAGARRKSDFIRDLGSSPPRSGGPHRFLGIPPAIFSEPLINGIQRRHTSSERVRTEPLNQSDDTGSSGGSGTLSGLQRGLSLGGRLKGSASLRRFLDHSRIRPEEKEALTQVSQKAAEHSSGDVFLGSEFEQLPLSSLHRHGSQRNSMVRTDSDLPISLVPNGFLPRRRVRNPIMVQPISVEPVPFHGGLVPNTRQQYRRYRRSLQRRQQRDKQAQEHQAQQRQQSRIPVSRSGSSSRPSFSVARSFSRRNELQSSLSTRSRGSLKEAHKAASRTALRSAGGSATPGTVLEMVPLGGSSNNNNNNNNNQENADGRWQDKDDDSTTSNAGAAGLSDEREGPFWTRGPQEYEAGPLLALNVLIVFPGDAGTREVLRMRSEEEEDYVGNNMARSVDEDEADRRSQNTLYNNNIIMEGTGIGTTPSLSPSGTSGHSSHASSDSRSSTSTGANTSVAASLNKINDAIMDDTEQRLPPMAIGTVFVPDPVRWWAYKAQQQVDRRRIQRELRRIWARQRQQQLQHYQQQQKSYASK
ncbi:hypothetical protein F5H01DRAFT_342426 [Linnemannia elongata]|nr:hypothetical protein F5H01DRAFT_342426 [Linnemannia elongata]